MTDYSVTSTTFVECVIFALVNTHTVTCFVITDNDTAFIECDLLGNANVIACPNDLVWDQSRLSCVYRFSVAGSGTGTSTGTGSGTSTGTGSGTSTGTGSGTDSGTGSGTGKHKINSSLNSKAPLHYCVYLPSLIFHTNT